MEMPRRSDAKEKMVAATKELIRERGYNATALSDVLERSAAPRGSVYFHFPGGKAELAMAAAAAHAADQLRHIDAAAEESKSAAELIAAYVDLGREGMVASGYARGCGVAPLVTEGATAESKEIAAASRKAFAAMIDRLASHLVAYGMKAGDAHDLADAVIAGVEGAMVTSRALRSESPYEAVRAVLVNQATSLVASR
jgi:TetR/AcrR family transcriptional regulator, lmrAB and yxaGH operons repressor